MHITNFAFLSAVATPKHLFSFVSSTVHIKPTRYDETHKVFVVELGVRLHIGHQMFEAKF